MTSHPTFAALAVQTLKDPKGAARYILSLNLPRNVLWTALFLVAVVNTMIFTASDLIAPTTTPLPMAFQSPAIFLMVVAGGLVITVLAIYWTGKMFGAEGRMDDVMVLMIWLQALRAVAQVAVLVLMFVAPAFASLLVLVAAIFALWLLLNFVNEALRLESLGKAAMVMIASTIAITLGLSMLLSVMGVTAMGIPANV